MNNFVPIMKRLFWPAVGELIWQTRHCRRCRQWVVLVLGLFYTGNLAAQSLIVGANVDINRQSGYQAEEAIAVNPVNPSLLFAWANDVRSGASDNAAGYSTNGGAVWKARFTGADGWPALGGDPTCSFDAFGNLFAASFDGSFGSIQVRASTNSGATFSNLLLTITSANLDQPTIKAGPSPASGKTAVWICHVDTPGLVARGMTVSGFNNFGTFGSALTVPNSSSGNFGDLAIGPAGQVAVAYQSPADAAGPSTIFLALNASGNTAGTFASVPATIATQVGGFRNIPAQPNRSVDAEVGLAWDISNGPHRGRLHMVYTDAANTTTSDLNIYTRYSDNAGTNWSAPHRVNTDAGTNSQFFPKIALDPTTGFIAVVWYDCRNSATDNHEELWGTVSLDGGVTFLPEVKISTGLTTGVNLGGGNELGDYLGLDFYGGIFHPCWADDSNSTGDNPDGTADLDIYTAAVQVAPAVPVLAAVGPATNGGFNFKVTCTPMFTLGVDTSTNLVQWTALGSGFTGTNGSFTFNDTNAVRRLRFYRAHWP